MKSHSVFFRQTIKNKNRNKNQLANVANLANQSLMEPQNASITTQRLELVPLRAPPVPVEATRPMDEIVPHPSRQTRLVGGLLLNGLE
jgi:hypothetical protein